MTPVYPMLSERLYVRLAPSSVAMFRFLLEAHGHLALFTVLDARGAVLRLLFAPGAEARVRHTLADIATTVPLDIIEPPASSITFIEADHAPF